MSGKYNYGTAIFTILMVATSVTSCSGERSPPPKKTPEEIRLDEVKSGFMASGEHWELRELIKRNLNDPDSYEHIETRYVDDGGDVLEVATRYRARNGFGALVVGSTLAKVHIDGKVVEIITSN